MHHCAQTPAAAPRRRGRFRLPLAVGILAAAGICGCAGPFAVRPADPLRSRERTAGPAPALLADPPERAARRPARAWLAEGVRAQRGGDPALAAGYYLRALEEMRPERGDASPDATEDRRFATARLTELCAPTLLADPRPLEIANGARRWRVTLRHGPGPSGIEPRQFKGLQPADRWEITRAPGFARVAGIGAPLLGELPPVLPIRASGDEPGKPVEGLTWAVTSRVALGPPAAGGRARGAALELFSPQAALAQSGLAADYTTPLAVTETRQSARRAWLEGFVRADKYLGLAGLFATEPPTPDKMPLVLVHGLLSDPGTFRVMHNALLADPEVRRRYQTWVFFYPSSLPVPYSAMLLREDLREFIRRIDPTGAHPALRRVALVGHSMGGILSRLAVTDGGERFYRHFLRRPLDSLDLEPKMRRLTRRAFFYRAIPEVRTVVFLGTPHRGSQKVLTPAGVIGRWLGRLPRQMAGDMQEILARNPDAPATPTRRIEGSVYLLGPRSPLVAALADMPPPDNGARLYSIIGDRGHPGPPAQGSDGVVRYQSSHLPGVRRETVVPADHSGLLGAPGAIEEVRRILRERAGE